MRTIQLTQGQVALVDDEDYGFLMRYKWFVHPRPKGEWMARGYVDGKEVLMHRLILNAPAGLTVDHINHNQLDNRRSNLRLCTQGENDRNKRKFKGQSRYKGVTPCGHKWRAWISLGGRSAYLGTRATEEEAAQLYNEAAIEHYGEFAWLNDLSEVAG